MSAFKSVVAAGLFFLIFVGGISVSYSNYIHDRDRDHQRLSATFYATTCPRVTAIVRRVVRRFQYRTDPRITASLARLHFHDCFVNGCDGSILLDNADKIESEKEALPNNNSVRGFDVIDEIKTEVERACPATVSCADILAMAAAESVCLSGGPSWRVRVGRRDSRIANRSGANTAIPVGFDTLDVLKSKFSAVGLDPTIDLVSLSGNHEILIDRDIFSSFTKKKMRNLLSGAHTFGRVQCGIIEHRLYNFSNTGAPDPTLNPTFLARLRRLCPRNGNGTTLANQDPITPDGFDNTYYSILRANKGLLTSDQALFSTPGADTIHIVNRFSASQFTFFKSFAKSMIKMGNISPLTGTYGEIRFNCRRVNDD
ncbi:Peroxidase 15 [Morus notabilis]|uniref:Peroxidase n=1 Tax=Morus notabilis TaxID=981085 RepID=W9RTT4_9ROSA|nr:Peroxidase 15 [Morus notabilis]